MIKFFKDAISEIHNVTWPTQKHYMHISMVAIVFTLSTAVFVGFLDFTFDKGIKGVAAPAQVQVQTSENQLDVEAVTAETVNGEAADVKVSEE